MAAWQTYFQLVPRRALTNTPAADVASMLDTTDWWLDATLPADYRDRLVAFAPPAKSPSADVEVWGTEDGNSIELRSRQGRVAQIRVRVDVRRPDAKFAAGLITFARAAGASLVRADGSVVEATAGGFGLALRGSTAWSVVYGARP